MNGVVRLGLLAAAGCTCVAAITGDIPWYGAAGGIAGATLVIEGLFRLRAANGFVDWLLREPEAVNPYPPAEPTPGPALPVPTDPTPATPQQLAGLRSAFEALDDELRQADQFRARVAAAQARRRDRVWPTPAERRLWTALRDQLEDA